MTEHDLTNGHTVQTPTAFEELAIEAGADAVKVVEYPEEVTIVVYVSGLSPREQEELIDAYADPWSGTPAGIRTIVDTVDDISESP